MDNTFYQTLLKRIRNNKDYISHFRFARKFGFVNSIVRNKQDGTIYVNYLNVHRLWDPAKEMYLNEF